MKITFLGTGTSQGIPVIGCDCTVCLSNKVRDKRLRVSTLIQIGNQNIVIDAGPDFRQQMLNSKIKHLDAILVTHEHNDHIAGIDDVRPFNFRSEVDMPIYAMKRVADGIITRFPYIFKENPYPGAPRVILNIISKKKFSIGKIEIYPISILHGALPILGYRINNFAYLTDIKTIEASQIAKLKDLKVLVISALQLNKHHSHCTLNETLALIKQIKPEKAYLIHMSHTMGNIDDVKSLLPNHVEFAFDGMVISI